MSQLCKACRQINWAVIDTAIDENKRITWRGSPVLEVGHRFREIPSSSRCPLCLMLHAPWIESFLQSEHGTNWQDFDEGDWIHLFPNLRHIHHVNDFPNSRNLLRHHDAPYHIAVIPKIRGWRKELRKRIYQHLVTAGMVVVLRDDSPESKVFHPQIIPAQFDPAIVRRWLRNCAHHQKLCNPKHPSVPGMRVIDCQSEDLDISTYSPGDDYMTLSYVWGNVEQPEADQSATAGSKAPLARLPADAPLTIRHAIEVTKALDCRFLWVDKYCINQDDPLEMQEQFSRMGDIYAGSSLTIFALGKNAEKGLPGLGSTPRLMQAQCRNGMYRFISSTPDPHWLIQQSKWANRGWTFQEGLFSTRSLFFTDYQVYFECNAMNCLESFKSNGEILHIRSRQRFKAMHRAGQYICGNSNQNSHFMVKNNDANHRKVDVLRQLQRQISQYTKRQLTHPSDVLDAFAGVTRFYARSNVRVASLAGIPVPFPFVQLPDTMQLGRDNLSYALAWRHAVDNLNTDFPRRYKRGPWVFNEADVDAGGTRSRGRQLPWSSRSNRKPQRRYGFPSWSWAGWFGEVTVRRDFPYCWSSLLSEVKIEIENGQIKDLAWLQESARYNAAVIRNHRTAKVLYFKAFVLDPENLDLSDALEDSESPTVRICLSEGPRTVKGLRQQLLDRKLECLVLGTHGRARDEVFNAIRNADRKSSKAKHRRIELLGRGGPGTIVCLLVRTNVHGESFRVGLLEVKYAGNGCDGGRSALRGWNTGPERRFVLK